ncbi:MAG: hypothetical protein ACK481_08910 [Candidatus Melainabacteria bacterium]|jgi:hypothetical protein
MNQEFNISNSAANIQKVVPVKRNGYILELQLPAPNLDSNLFVQQSSQSSNSLNSNTQQTNSISTPQKAERIIPPLSPSANIPSSNQASLQNRQVIINNQASQFANQQTNNSNQVIEDQELPEKVEAQKFNNSKLEQFKNLFRR